GVVLNPAPARDLPDALLALSPVLTPNRDEARALSGEDEPEAAALALAGRTGSPAVVTVGAQGALVADGGTVERVPAPAVDVLDPGPLAELDVWLAPYRRLWNEGLDALGRHLDDTATEED